MSTAAAPSSGLGRPPRVLRLRFGSDAERRAWTISAVVHLVVIVAVLAWPSRTPQRLVMTTVALAGDPRPAAPSRAAAPPARTPQRPRPRPPEPTPRTPARPETRPVEVPAPLPEPVGVAPRTVETPKPKPAPARPKPESKPAPAARTPARAEPVPEPAAPVAAATGDAAGAADSAGTSGIEASVEGVGGVSDAYLSSIVRRVSSKWQKPAARLPARAAAVTADMDRSGRLSGIRLTESSGIGEFDRAALRALDLASPLPAMPSSVEGPGMKLNFQFVP